MQILRLLSVSRLATLFGFGRAARVVDAWREHLRRPGVLEDLAALGHLFEDDMVGGAPPGSDELVARAARKSLVLQLIARGEITHAELNAVRRETHDELSENFRFSLGDADGADHEDAGG